MDIKLNSRDLSKIIGNALSSEIAKSLDYGAIHDSVILRIGRAKTLPLAICAAAIRAIEEG